MPGTVRGKEGSRGRPESETRFAEAEKQTRRDGDVDLAGRERNTRQLLTFPGQVLTGQAIAETYCMPGCRRDAAMDTVQPLSLRKNTNRHDKLNDKTNNKGLGDQGTRCRRARNVENTLFRPAGESGEGALGQAWLLLHLV